MSAAKNRRRIVSLLSVLAAAALLATWPWPAQYAVRSAAAQAPTCRELLVNGGFEEGDTGWSQSSAGGYGLISDFHPRTGRLAAFLGGANQADDRLSQQIALPAGVISATLSFWWAISTTEPGVAFDRMAVSLRRPDGALLADLMTIDSSAAENLWDLAEFDLTGYGGQSVILAFHATTDANNATDFYVDDASLVVCLGSKVYLPILLR